MSWGGPFDAKQKVIPRGFSIQKWLLPLLVSLPLVVGGLLAFSPMTRMEAQLEANVSAFSFVSATQQDFSDPLGIVGFNAAGLDQIEIPATHTSHKNPLRVKTV